jgi:hypothetical protein
MKKTTQILAKPKSQERKEGLMITITELKNEGIFLEILYTLGSLQNFK